MANFFLLYFGIVDAVYLALLVLAASRILCRAKVQKAPTENLLEITFIIPAYNESHRLITVVNNILNLSCPNKQILIVNDGSQDEMLSLLQNQLALSVIPLNQTDKLPAQPVKGVYQSQRYPEIRVIDKVNGSRFDALNAALNYCTSSRFITVDADTWIDDTGLNAFLRQFSTNPDAVACSAMIGISNGCALQGNRIDTSGVPQDYLSAMQSLEYLRESIMHIGWDDAGGNAFFQGAFSAYKTQVLIETGGFAPTFNHDLEIILRLQNRRIATQAHSKIFYVPAAVAWTEGPQPFKRLGLQRRIWQCGFLESIWTHKGLIFNPAYKAFGLFSFPFFCFGETMQPLMEILGYLFILLGLCFGAIESHFLILFLSLTWGFTFLYTAGCLLLEKLFLKTYSLKSLLRLFSYSLVESFGYRQAILISRALGFKDFFRKAIK